MRSVGVIGTGDIAEVYLRNAAAMRNYRVVCVASRDLDRAKRRAAAWNVEALPVEDLLSRGDIEIVLNLTPPAAHFATTMAALSAGKHVFSEKPLGITFAESAVLAEETTRRGLRLAVAPDSILGAGLQKARAMIDAGAIGKPLIATAAILYHGAESWHPNPSFFYRAAGGGPIHDVGPYFLSALAVLLGPIARVQATGFKGFATRMVTAPGPEQGHVIPVEVFTSVQALATFRSGVEATLMASWDVWQNSQPDLEVHGTEGSLSLPHPNWHGGPLRYARAGGPWQDVPLIESPLARPNWPPENPRHCNYRGIGIAEMVEALDAGLPHRTSAELAGHVVEAADGIVAAARGGRSVSLISQPERPRPFTPPDASRLFKERASDAPRTG